MLSLLLLSFPFLSNLFILLLTNLSLAAPAPAPAAVAAINSTTPKSNCFFCDPTHRTVSPLIVWDNPPDPPTTNIKIPSLPLLTQLSHLNSQFLHAIQQSEAYTRAPFRGMKRNIVIDDSAHEKRRVFQLAIIPKPRINVPGMNNEEAYGVLRDVYEGIRRRVLSSEGSTREVVFRGLGFEVWAQGGDGRVDVLGGGYLREVGSSSGGGSGNGNEGLQSS